MAAERRYSITAKPLHEPIPTTQVVVLQPVRKGSRPIVVGDRDDGVDDGYYVDSDGQPIKKSRDAVVPLAGTKVILCSCLPCGCIFSLCLCSETHSSAQGGTVSTTAALLAMKPSRLFNKPTPAGDVEAVHGAAEPQVPTKRHKRKGSIACPSTLYDMH